MNATVVIPWRPGCPHRAEAMAHVLGWWTTHHPTWPIVTGTDRDDGPWCKGLAVANALDTVTTPIVIVADADVIVPDIHLAVAAVSQGHPWAAPFRTVLRLSQLGTSQVYATGTLPPEPVPAGWLDERYTGQPGGGLVVLPTTTARTVPIDPRFQGWGQEDLSWARALYVLAGGPWRSTSPLYHLWHPPAERISHGIGSQAGLDLFMRYRKAVHPTLMVPLIKEAIAVLAQDRSGPAEQRQP